MTATAFIALVPHAPHWAAAAARDVARVQRALGQTCHAVHHVGSTSVPGIQACPVLDLRMVLLGHNTIRGAAGQAVQIAELLVAGGRVGRER